MAKLPSGPAKAPSSGGGPSKAPAPPSDSGGPFGLKRSHLIGIGTVVALVALFFIFRPGGDDEAESDKTAQGKKGKKGKGKSKSKSHRAGLCSRLKCSEEQKAVIRPLVAKFRQDISEDEKGRRQAWAELATAYGDESFDEADIDDAYATIAEHDAAIAQRARETIAAVHEQLEPQQREMLGKLISRDGPAAIFEKGAGLGISERPHKNKKHKKERKRDRKAKRDRAATVEPGSGSRRPFAAEIGASRKAAEEKFRREREEAEAAEAEAARESAAPEPGDEPAPAEGEPAPAEDDPAAG